MKTTTIMHGRRQDKIFLKQCYPSKCLIAFEFCFSFPTTVNKFRILLMLVLIPVKNEHGPPITQL